MAETDFIDDKSTAPDHPAPDPREVERLAWLSEFERTWYPVFELKTAHKERIKEYYARQQKQEGRTVICQSCGQLCGFDWAEIHHPDHNERNNVLGNLRVYCKRCNQKERTEWLKQRNSRTHAIDSTIRNQNKEKEKTLSTAVDEQRSIELAPWTAKNRVRRLEITLDYLLENVTKPTLVETCVVDLVAKTRGAKPKIEEYIDVYSQSAKYSPFRQWLGAPDSDDGSRALWIAPRTIENETKPHPEYARALEEYQQRKNGGEPKS